MEVAPLVGAWIEINYKTVTKGSERSLPSWERGLKLHLLVVVLDGEGRSPRGSVD